MTPSPLNNCANCKERFTAGLKACGRCLTVKYCSRTCQHADWGDHKAFCATQSTITKSTKNLTGVNGNVKAIKDDATAWFIADRHLQLRVNFLAWKYRSQYPLLLVTTSSFGVDADVIVEAVPRSRWDTDSADPWSPDTIKQFRSLFDRKDHDEEASFVLEVNVKGQQVSSLTVRPFVAVISRTHSDVFSTLTAEEYAAEAVRRETYPAGTAFVRLKGLRSATLLNGREGVVKGEDPRNSERCIVRLNDCKELSVQPSNFEMVNRPRLFVEEFNAANYAVYDCS
mmetsp:Transcript_25991/g.65079  ORF Transcript_25991/g.65079 Transcript_25991/m.65079 type:complete len:284 (-) Transcript_25991:353-1204(-)